MTSTKTDFYTALTPCHTMQLYSGVADFTVEGSVNNRTLKIFDLRSWYKLTFIISTLTVTAIFVLLNDVIAPFKAESVFYWFVAFYDLHIDYIIMMVSLASSLIFRDTLIQSWQKIMITDAALCNFKPKINDVFVKRLSQSTLIFYFTCNTLTHLTTDDIVSHQEIKFFVVSNVLYWILDFYRICASCVFQAWILSLKLRFEALHEWVYVNEKFIVSTELHEIRKLHRRLCEIVNKINQVYAWPVLLNLTTNLWIFIFQAYNIAILSNWKNWKVIVNVMGYLVWAGFEIVSIIVSCALLVKHERMLRRRLYAVVNANICLQKELKSLSLQMMHFNSECTLGGNVGIDAPLLFQVLFIIGESLILIVKNFSLPESASRTS
ncbi:hypothetical protein FQR65_LT00181 [Abscondita terminalis]|nr:hypothetical protein FQR65_LT00181 [Abscondita terminalis]